jgi:hypothetical protein
MPKTIEEIRAASNERQKLYRAHHPQRAKDSVRKWKEKNPTYFIEWREKNPATVLIGFAKARAKKGRLPFDLYEHTEEIQRRLGAGVCEMSGLPFEKGITVPGPLSASIDRIEPKLGYVYSNIRIICLALNRAFGDWGEEELFRIVDAVRARISQAPISNA